MDIPESITKVFTKYDTIVKRIEVPFPILDFVCDDFSCSNCWVTNSYYLWKVEQGLDNVVFAHYIREYAGGFIGESVGTLVDCKASGEVNLG